MYRATTCDNNFIGQKQLDISEQALYDILLANGLKEKTAARAKDLIDEGALIDVEKVWDAIASKQAPAPPE
eukprot:14518561-Heterocapsa_arctica.AAC.1